MDSLVTTLTSTTMAHGTEGMMDMEEEGMEEEQQEVVVMVDMEPHREVVGEVSRPFPLLYFYYFSFSVGCSISIIFSFSVGYSISIIFSFSVGYSRYGPVKNYNQHGGAFYHPYSR